MASKPRDPSTRSSDQPAARAEALERQQHYPNEPEERNAASVRLNDSPTGCAGRKQMDVADADKKARTGTESEPVRNTPPFGDWDATGPVSPDPQLERG